MKALFLDIDGVLNTSDTIDHIDGERVCDADKMILLKSIVDRTECKIVLVSSKKLYWHRNDKERQRAIGNYLDAIFAKYGMQIYDKTEDDGINRGFGVMSWRAANPCRSIAILDDTPELYDILSRLRYLVNVSRDTGLTDKDVERVVALLENDGD